MVAKYLDKSNRVKVGCICNTFSKKYKIVEAIFDTGACVTLFSAKALGTMFSKQDVVAKTRGISISGFATDRPIIVYRVKINQLTLGTLDLEEQYIFITFDDAVKTNVVGMDIISQLSFYYSNDVKRLCIFKNNNDLVKFIRDEDTKNLASAFNHKYNKSN